MFVCSFLVANVDQLIIYLPQHDLDRLIHDFKKIINPFHMHKHKFDFLNLIFN